MKFRYIVFLGIILCTRNAATQNPSGSADSILMLQYPARIMGMVRWFQGELRNADGSFKAADLAGRKAVITRFQQVAIRAGDPKAALFARVTLHSHVLLDTSAPVSAAIRNADHIASMARRLDFPYAEAQAYQELSFFFGRKQQAVRQIYYALKSFDIYQPLSVDHYPFKKYALYSLALAYHRLSNHTEAKKYALLATRTDGGNKWDDLYLKHLMGVIYREESSWQEARKCFQENYQRSLMLGSSKWLAISSGHLGIIYARTGQRALAFDFLHRAADSCSALGILDNAVMFRLEMARFLEEEGDYVALDKLLKSGLKEDLLRAGTHAQMAEYFRRASQLARSEGNLSAALICRDSLEFYMALAEHEKNLLAIAQVHVQLGQERFSSMLQIERLSSKNRQLRWMLLSGLAMAALILLVYSQQRKKKSAERRASFAELEREKVHLELKKARLRLDEFMLTLQHKNIEIDQLRQERMGYLHRQVIPAEAPMDEALRRNPIITEQDWQKFMELFEGTYPGYLRELKLIVPDITAAELRFLALSRLQLSTREMAALLGVGESAVRSVKSRLRKKLPPGAVD